jgi:hypothetical protein
VIWGLVWVDMGDFRLAILDFRLVILDFRLAILVLIVIGKILDWVVVDFELFGEAEAVEEYLLDIVIELVGVAVNK